MLPVAIGMAGTAAMLAFYLVIQTLLTGSFAYAASELLRTWYWLIAISAGFGTQLGLFAYMHKKAKEAKATLAANGTISTGSMVMCCAHHLTDTLPFLGISAIAVILSRYQTFFYLVAIFSNLIGITIMVRAIQKNLPHVRGPAKALFSINMETARNITILSAAVILTLSFIISTAAPVQNQLPMQETSFTNLLFTTQTSEANGLTVKATPRYLADKLVFDISLDTHQGSLDADLTKNTVLKDSEGRAYYPESWEGSPPGGHHRSGTLTFAVPASGSKSITLTITDMSGVPERTLQWKTS
ncbi:hypothetical protein HY640_02175 [Candidatus Woesearchaeota archaeon]|nr:hypothetical protein [Candidatus Woesearchaeota archaeon]